MKETRFIEQNKKKWDEFERLLKAKKKDPDQLSNLFVEITDDLSYSRTYYPNRLVRAYLNNISQKIYLNLYKNRKQPLEKIKFFFTEDLPFILYESRKSLLISFLVFSFATLIGIVSCLNDPDYAAVVTSKYYVAMTEANIENGDPMAVYKDQEPFNMFLYIAWNNLRVAFYCFALGITACVGTVFFMINNGTMLGGFQFFFYTKGVFWESVITIWQHGTIEILCIIIAGGAGIVMGKGLLFPGSYHRAQSLQISAKKGLKIMLSITPLIVLAALIEGYITRLTEAPLLFRLLVILLSLAVMLGYFIYYPWKKSKTGFHASLKYEKPKPSKIFDLSLTKIKSIGVVFTESLTVYKSYIKNFFFLGVVAGIIFGLTHVYYYEQAIFVWDFDGFIDILGALLEYMLLSFFEFFRYFEKPAIAIINVILMGTIMSMAASVVRKASGQKRNTKKQGVINFLIAVLYAIVLNVVFVLDSGFMYVLFVLIQPLVMFPLAAKLTDNKSMFNSISSGLGYLFGGFFQVVLLQAMLSVIFILFMLIANTSLAGIMVDFVRDNFLMDAQTMAKFSAFSSAFLSIFTFCLVYPIYFVAFAIHYHALKEQKDALHLKSRIENFETA